METMAETIALNNDSKCKPSFATGILVAAWRSVLLILQGRAMVVMKETEYCLRQGDCVLPNWKGDISLRRNKELFAKNDHQLDSM